MSGGGRYALGNWKMAHDAATMEKLKAHVALGRDIVFVGAAYGAERRYVVRAQHFDRAVRLNAAGHLEMLEHGRWVSTESCAIRARDPKSRRGRA